MQLMPKMTRLIRLFTIFLVLLKWSQGAHAVSERTRLEHLPSSIRKVSRTNSFLRPRFLKSKGGKSSKTKWGGSSVSSSSSSTSAPDDDKSASAASYKPPTKAPTSANIFDESSEKEGSGDDNAARNMPHVIAKISVAISREDSAPAEIEKKVAKVTTKVIRSYTPFVVYMLDGTRRRDLQQSTSTDLEYDPKFSSISLAFHSVEYSWWTYSVAYKVTKAPEEIEETSEINGLAESAVEGAIQSGLFEQLLLPIEPKALGVSVPGREMAHVFEDEPTNEPKDNPRPTGSLQSGDDSRRNRVVAIILAVSCIAVIVAIFAIGIIARRIRSRANEAAWTISLGEQKDKGEVVHIEWNSAYNGEAKLPSDILEPSRSPSTDAPGSYMFGRWELGADGTIGSTERTAEGTDDASAFNGNLSVDCSALNSSLDSSLSIDSAVFDASEFT